MNRFKILIPILLLTQISFAQEIPYQLHRISDRVIVIADTSPWEGSLAAISTKKGIVLIDTGPSRKFARQARQIFADEFGRDDFIYVINTHHHYDHTNGNQEFIDCTIIGHENCIPDMEKFVRDKAEFIEYRRDMIERFKKELGNQLTAGSPDNFSQAHFPGPG